MSTVRICCVGAGRAGAVHAVNVHELLRGAEVAAVVDADSQAAAVLSNRVGDAPVFESLEEACGAVEIDAVVVATPTFTHHELALLAFQHGAHVFCEKPLALSIADCDEMIAAADHAGRQLQVGFVRRFQPEFAEAKQRIDAGEIGDPMVIKSLTRGPGLPPPWAQVVEYSNGMLAEVNSHDFDSVRWLAGSDIERVYAEVANRKGERLGVTEEGFYDNAVVALRFENDALGTVDGTCPADYGYDARVEIVGSKGLLTIGETLGKAILTCVDRDRGGMRPVHRTWPDRFDWGYVNEIRSFVERVRSGEPVEVDGIDGRRAVAAVVAANTSWLEERPVRLAEVA
jgi:myo-inositol 2-dehydrogenase/D-chiro-inositol 1-dehydrogenase/scyllo-inositol 2-dehydrogenase (NAD+)